MKHQIGFSKLTIFWLFPSVRAYDNETAAKLVCRGQLGWRKDVSIVAANFEVIFTPVGGTIVLNSSCCQNLILFIYGSLQPYRKNQILPRWYPHLVHDLTSPPTIYMLCLCCPSWVNQKTPSSNCQILHSFISLAKFKFAYVRVCTRAGICLRLVVLTSTGTSL